MTHQISEKFVWTDNNRRSVLQSYIDTEPTIRVNCDTYCISTYLGEEGIMFYAVDTRKHILGARVFLPRIQWEKLHSGLSLAYLYNAVLEKMESIIRHTGGFILS